MANNSNYKTGNYNGNQGQVSFFSKMSTKCSILVLVLAALTVASITLVSVISNTSVMEDTYQTYALNLAEEAAVGVDFATQSGEETYKNYAYNLAEQVVDQLDFTTEVYKGYAQNLAEEAVVGINSAITFGEETYKNYALSLAKEAVVGYNTALSLNGGMTKEVMDSIVGKVQIAGVEGSYAYLVSPTGTMLWHPTASKIGAAVENSAVQRLVAELKTGFKVDDGSVLYEYKDALKLAGYAFTKDGNILVVTADYDKFMKVDYDSLIGNVKISGVEGSYAYMVSPEGTMLWHTVADKIGNPVENAAVKGLVQRLEAGETPEEIGSGAIVYEYKGANKLAGYAFTVNGNILVVTADYNTFMDFDGLLGEIELSGVEGSYAYMVSPDGTMLWHPDSAKIGNPVENAAVKSIVADLQAGKTVKPGAVLYEYKGSYKLAGYDFTSSGDILLVTADYDKFIKIDYASLIGEIEITNVAGSYAYLVSPEGKMLWHTDSSKIGEPVENAAVKEIVSKVSRGEKVPDGATVYEYKNAMKLAGYAFTKNGNIVVVTADYDEFIAPVNSQKMKMIGIGAAATLFAIIAAYFAVTMMLKAFDKMVPVITDTAEFNFVDRPEAEALYSRKDEFGVMAGRLRGMRKSLRNIVESIDVAGKSISGNVDNLQKITYEVNKLCADNSATTQQLAAGMEETSASTKSITENINSIQHEAQDIEALCVEGTSMSADIMKRASDLRATTEQASARTIDMFNQVKTKSNLAVDAAKAVDKISELTGTIMEISSQTRMLSLNASIEAARAGEAGRGFAIVAKEIGNLSNQTTTAVSSITGIVGEVNDAVNNMADCLADIIRFLEENVLNDYKDFGSVSDRYRDDADGFKSSMSEIRDSIANLNSSIATVVEAIESINSTVAESAGGVSDIASKTTDIVSQTGGTTDKVDECRKYVKQLENIIEQFTLE